MVGPGRISSLLLEIEHTSGTLHLTGSGLCVGLTDDRLVSRKSNNSWWRFANTKLFKERRLWLGA
jgi:hypothetical protein